MKETKITYEKIELTKKYSSDGEVIKKTYTKIETTTDMTKFNLPDFSNCGSQQSEECCSSEDGCSFELYSSYDLIESEHDYFINNFLIKMISDLISSRVGNGLSDKALAEKAETYKHHVAA